MGRLFHKKYFQKGDLREDTGTLKNPARGWYRMYTFPAEQEPDLRACEPCLHPEDTLVFVFVDIGGFRDRELDGEALGRIARILDYFSQKGCDCIVRIAYDHEGKAMEREPLFFGQVRRHLEQLGEILQKYAEHIFVWQGMLAGNWGEMHTSRYLSKERLVQMAEILRRFRGTQTWLAVRRPMYWRMLHGETAENGGEESLDMGIFDDGIFGSASHLGTFGVDRREQVSWEHAWSREEELAFLNMLGDRAPAGGEAVYGGNDTEKRSAGQIIRELRQMQITYLNRDYDRRILEKWKRQRCLVPGVWAGKSLYDYIGAHLGYRFLVRNVRFVRTDRAGGGLAEIRIQNIGFAGYYQNAELYLECRKAGAPACRAEPAYQMKGWKSGEIRRFSWMVEAGTEELLLTAERTKDQTRICFANKSDAEGKVRLGSMTEAPES